MKTGLCIASYLGAVIAANGLVSSFGQIAMPLTAFILIAFDLLARDILHERWKGRNLWPKMILLVASGSFLSYISSIASPQVSFASAASFMLVGLVDGGVYWALDQKDRVIKMNGSNLASAVVDSLLFPLMAFGSIEPWISGAQVVCKFSGGFVWTALFLYLIRRNSNAPNNAQA